MNERITEEVSRLDALGVLEDLPSSGRHHHRVVARSRVVARVDLAASR